MKLHADREMFSNAIHATSQMLGMAPEFVEKYNTEVGALSYGIIPKSDEILESASRLFEDVKKIIK